MIRNNYSIIQTISGMSLRSGGPTTATRDLLKAINHLGKQVRLVTLSSQDNEDISIDGTENWITILPNDSRTPISYSYNLKKYLETKEFDLYHTNGLWLYVNHITCKKARRLGKPYIITTHGMLNPLAVKRSYWKKWPIIKIWFDKDIKEATCIHATCKKEMQDIRMFGYNGPIAIIPNPIPPYTDANRLFEEKCKRLYTSNGKRTFGFLGRLHPVKKVENIIYGFSLLGKKEKCEVLIMGKGEDDYETFLKSEVKRLGLNNVKFIGFVNGNEKFKRLAELSALFVPSDFENFGMIVTEALTVGTPVMASLGTPWEELNSNDCGWWVDRTPENIADIMNKIVSSPNEELINKGKNGMNLVKEKYIDEKVAEQMISVYEWMLNGGTKPNYVYTV